MAKIDDPLSNVKVASPCSADWNNMAGDDRKRFCGDCKLNVYNLSGMTSYDAENLLRNSEGRMCVRFYKRADGTILTQDCPVGWARVKQRAAVFAAAAFSVIFSLAGLAFLVSMFGRDRGVEVMGAIPIKHSVPSKNDKVRRGDMPVRKNVPVKKIDPEPLMGEVMLPAGKAN